MYRASPVGIQPLAREQYPDLVNQVRILLLIVRCNGDRIPVPNADQLAPCIDAHAVDVQISAAIVGPDQDRTSGTILSDCRRQLLAARQGDDWIIRLRTSRPLTLGQTRIDQKKK